uniref:HDC02628 n=1 Tax=Drosophila melanogaster TaxID=7227 RepID=Q6IHG5_DROME|nr:TPA_inf: HDC02628 [Drosophila melanogaster]
MTNRPQQPVISLLLLVRILMTVPVPDRTEPAPQSFHSIRVGIPAISPSFLSASPVHLHGATPLSWQLFVQFVGQGERSMRCRLSITMAGDDDYGDDGVHSDDCDYDYDSNNTQSAG